MTALVDRAAARLRTTSRAFTRRNLYHVARRLDRRVTDYETFITGPLARRLKRGPIDGLLPPPAARAATRLPRECDAYFPAAIVVVDRPAIVDLFAASGVLVQARLAVVCIDGTPGSVVRWLQRGIRAGFRAPIGYLHDAATVLYPFAFEPLGTLVDALGAHESLSFVDLGLPPGGLAPAVLPFAGTGSRPITELEAVPPAAIVAYAARRLGGMLPRDPWLAPLVPGRRRDRRAAR